MNLALDLDGTLITCEPRQSSCLRAAARAEGTEIDVQAAWVLKRSGLSTQAALEALGLSITAAGSIARRWIRQIEEPQWLCLDRMFPDAARTLAALRHARVRLAILTARRQPGIVRQQVARLGIADSVEALHVVDPADARAAKAHLLAVGRFDAFIGDTESDYGAAAQAGTPFFPVSCGQRGEAFLRQQGVGVIHASFRAAADAAVAAISSPPTRRAFRQVS